MPEQNDTYIILTPAGVLHGFSSANPSEQQLALQAVLAPEESMTARAWGERYSDTWLDMFIEEGWIETIEKRVVAPHVQLDNF